MSRMTKFLMQKASVTKMKRNTAGDPILNEYGEPQYELGTTVVKCRKERNTKDILTTGGAAAVSTTKYFLDNSISVDIGDKIDGKPILTVTDFINAIGVSEGWEVTV